MLKFPWTNSPKILFRRRAFTSRMGLRTTMQTNFLIRIIAAIPRRAMMENIMDNRSAYFPFLCKPAAGGKFLGFSGTDLGVPLIFL